MAAHNLWHEVPPTTIHGFHAHPSWRPPRCSIYCDEQARPGYSSSCLAHEFEDDPTTLAAKIAVFADLIRSSSNFLCYTGAGISTASGIGDYASKAKHSLGLEGVRKKKTGFDAEPTLAHRVLAALAARGLLKQWVQQNHDGLPQKAGVPCELLNEIHGAWYDPSNPVVPMSGSLRDDLCERLVEWEARADLVLAMGTSLCGMNADRLVSTAADKAAAGRGRGAVIVGLQRTPYDAGSALRIFARCDDVARLLAAALALAVPPPRPYRGPTGGDVFDVPYDAEGSLSSSTSTQWDLRAGAAVRVTAGPGRGFRGTVLGRTRDGQHFRVRLPCQREGSKQHGKGQTVYVLGGWWIRAAVEGRVPRLPVVNAVKA